MLTCPQCKKDNRDSAVFCVSCGFRIDNGGQIPVTLYPPSNIPTSLQGGRYKIKGVLGEGGMGRALLSTDTKMKWDVVIKQMIPPQIMTREDKDFLEKCFEEEARILFQLNHSNLPQVKDYFVEQGNMFLVMTFLKGTTLNTVLEKHPDKKLPLKECFRWMKTVLDILYDLHHQEPPVLHRDIKPSNIMLTDKGEIFLIDFGIARTAEIEAGTKIRSCLSQPVVSLGYSPPELYRGSFRTYSGNNCL